LNSEVPDKEIINSNDPKALYLDLMKNTLSFSLWPEPVVAAGTLRNESVSFAEKIAFIILKIMSLFTKKYLIAVRRDIGQQQKIEGLIWPGYAHTMIGMKRLDNLQHCIEAVLNDGVEGDLIETGVWRGGASIFMRAVLAAYGIKDRKVFVADSFQGLPEPDTEKWSLLHKEPFLAVSLPEVEANFKKYGLLDDQVVFLKGWFKDTLPKAQINKISIMRLDGDMYGSTMESLEILYPKLSKGGFCIIDDYGLPSCRKAVEDFRAKHNITSELLRVDWTGVYWRRDQG
jgi:O-methyltransferase